MKAEFTAEELDFQSEVKTFLNDEFPAEFAPELLHEFHDHRELLHVDVESCFVLSRKTRAAAAKLAKQAKQAQAHEQSE